MKTKSKDKIC